MKTMIKKCPSCRHDLTVAVLRCPECGLEMKNDFEMSRFDKLSDEQADFLTAFLRNRGNLKNLQAELQISYPYAKKKLDDVLAALGIAAEEQDADDLRTVDISNVSVDRSSMKASEIIKAKLVEAGGRTKVRLFGGELRDIIASPNGRDFLCPPMIPLSYGVFDAVVDLLLRSPGYRARKGNARNFRLGEPGCEENTVAGTVLEFMGKKPGETGLDPVFMLAAVLEWADIASNGRGEILLKESYRSRL